MTIEIIQIGYMTLSGLLFALGGTTGFNKAYRRVGLPVLTALYLLALHTGLLVVGLVSSGLYGALTLGYGESKSFFYKFCVGVAFILPTVLLGFTYWQIITPLVFITLFFLSNWKPTAQTFFWKAIEFTTGTLISITVITAKGV